MDNQKCYLLYVDNKPVGSYDNLSAAQLAAESAIEQNLFIRIESMAAPAPTQAWIYDDGMWVKSQ